MRKEQQRGINRCPARYAPAAPAVAAVCLAVLAAGCGPSSRLSAASTDPPEVAVVEVARRDITKQLTIASEFQPFQQINVYAKVSGYVKKLYVDWGSHVSTGQLLAVLEIPELEQQLQLDQAAVRRSQQEVGRAQEELRRAQSAYQVAHLTYTRLANVQKTRPELVAQEEVDVAQGKDLEASASVSAAKDALSAAGEGLAAANAALQKDKDMYSYSRITAPFDGVVTELDAYTGSLLPAGTSSNKGDQPLCRLSQNDLLRLVIPVPERAVSSIRLGETVTVDVSALQKQFAGKIVRFSGEIDPETRTMRTEVNVPNAKYELVPGMYASIELPLLTEKNVLTVPVQAVRMSSQDHGSVLVVDQNDHVQRRAVTLGLESPSDVEIVSGLSDRDRVILGEQTVYQAGELVTPKLLTAAQEQAQAQ